MKEEKDYVYKLDEVKSNAIRLMLNSLDERKRAFTCRIVKDVLSKGVYTEQEKIILNSLRSEYIKNHKNN